MSSSSSSSKSSTKATTKSSTKSTSSSGASSAGGNRRIEELQREDKRAQGKTIHPRKLNLSESLRNRVAGGPKLGPSKLAGASLNASNVGSAAKKNSGSGGTSGGSGSSSGSGSSGSTTKK